MIRAVYSIICNPIGWIYVGASSDVEQRWMNHRGLLDRGKHHCRRLQADWEIFGRGSFDLSLLERVPPYDWNVYRWSPLEDRETEWIVHLQQQVPCYNKWRVWRRCPLCLNSQRVDGYVSHVQGCVEKALRQRKKKFKTR